MGYLAAGWLSGSLYINVPPKSKAESGNLVISVGEEKDETEIHTDRFLIVMQIDRHVQEKYLKYCTSQVNLLMPR